MNREVWISPDPLALVARAAETVLNIATAAVAERGRFVIALSGGSTPKALHKFLAGQAGPHSEAIFKQFPWSQTHVFLGDERHVPIDHADSNFRMAQETLLNFVEIPAAQIHPVRTELAPAEAASDYAGQLADLFGTTDVAGTQFDLILLGLGDDGHTASLFPGCPEVHDTTSTVLSTYVEKLDAHRVSFGRTLINAARQVMFLIQGEKKQLAVGRLLAETGSEDETPSRVVAPVDGKLIVLTDAAAQPTPAS